MSKPKTIPANLAELITKASHDAGFLADSIRDAHKIACMSHPVASLVLLPLIADAQRISDTIGQLIGALMDEDPECDTSDPDESAPAAGRGEA